MRFLTSGFFMNQFPSGPRISHLAISNFYKNSQRYCNFVFNSGVNDTGDKLFANVNDTSDKLLPVSLTPVIETCSKF
jgi:hypothetical protein